MRGMQGFSTFLGTPDRGPASSTASIANNSYNANDAPREMSVSFTSQPLNSVYAHISSPPTPVPSPDPSMPDHSPLAPVADIASSEADAALLWASLAPTYLPYLSPPALTTLLTALLPNLNSAQAMHVASLLPPRLKRDFLADLPPEIALHILGYIEDVRTLTRASAVSCTWRLLVADETPWKMMCARRGFNVDEDDEGTEEHVVSRYRHVGSSGIHDSNTSGKNSCGGASLYSSTNVPQLQTQVPHHPFSYRKYFKTAHLTELNWRHSGRLLRSHRSQDAGVVTSLALDAQWIVVGLANSRVHVFSASTGVLARTLVGHDAGVWSLWLVSRGGGKLNRSSSTRKQRRSALIPEAATEDGWASMPQPSIRTDDGVSPSSTSSSSSSSSGDLPFQSVFDSLRPNSRDESGDANANVRQSDPCNASQGWGQANALVISGGCDKQIRVWDVKSGYCLYVLRGHRSTIRCMKVFHGRPIAVSGSRDHTLRVWDVQKGTLLRTLEGHTDSVRCLDVFGDRVVSGSYDCTVRLWDVNTGECLRVFNGHYHQVYSIAFDGERIASGGLDTTVRVWSASTGSCLALLQGHTALVCQLQLNSRTNTLVTGSSDGRIIIFSIAPAYEPLAPLSSPPAPSPSTPDPLTSPPSSPALGSVADTSSADATPDQAYRIVTRVSAHSSSVTGLQSDERPGRRWVVSGGNDGRVLLWDLSDRRHPGSRGEMTLVRDLTEPCECLWKVAFRDDIAVICCLRAGRTVLEIWSFRPVEEDL